MVGTGQDGVDAGPHFLRVISIDLRLVTNSDVGHPFVLLLLLLSSSLFRLADQRGGKRGFSWMDFFAQGSLYYFDAVCKSWCAKVERKRTNFKNRSASNKRSNRLVFLPW